MKQEFETFKTEMDCWVKNFQSELTNYDDMVVLLGENAQNIDHNYELIQQVRKEIKHLREELYALRTLQLMALKAKKN